MIKYQTLLSIPLKDRLPGLIDQYGAKRIHGILVVMITQFCNSFNVIRPMTAEQIVDCAGEILNTSHEDFLSVEDIMIFFQGAKMGKYGKVFDRLDQQIIFSMLEVYREVRHRMYNDIKEEREANLKALGPQFRTSEDMQEIKELFHQANVDYYKIQQKQNDGATK